MRLSIQLPPGAGQQTPADASRGSVSHQPPLGPSLPLGHRDGTQRGGLGCSAPSTRGIPFPSCLSALLGLRADRLGGVGGCQGDLLQYDFKPCHGALALSRNLCTWRACCLSSASSVTVKIERPVSVPAKRAFSIHYTG